MNEILTTQRCLEVLSAIACDSEERTTERLKAIELLTKIKAQEVPSNGITIVDDIPWEE